jgi:hypothetical protein
MSNVDDLEIDKFSQLAHKVVGQGQRIQAAA